MRRLSTFFLIVLLVAALAVLVAALAVPVAAQTATTTEAETTSVRTDILPGVELTVEEVEPGVYRVLDDGVRVLRGKGVVAGDDGSIWLTRNYDFLPLGSPQREVHRWPKSSESRDLVVTEDGTVWRTYWLNAPEGKDGPEGPRLQFLDDGSWTQLREAKGIEEPVITPDGTLWTLRSWGGPTDTDGPQPHHQVLRLGTSGWEPFGNPAPVGGRLFVTPDGEAWVIPLADLGFGGSMWRYREGASGWQEVPLDVVVWSFWPEDKLVEVGADGTVWFAAREPLMADGEPVSDGETPTPGDTFLMRYDGTEWQRWGQADGVPALWTEADEDSQPSLAQARDGALWVVEDRIDRFDGSTWQQFLPGHTLGGWDIAPDGSVWLLANGPYGQGLYVITPEAVAEY